MFDTDQLIADCRVAIAAENSSRHIKEILTRAVSESASVIAAIGAPIEGGIVPLYRSAELTILNVLWQPKMVIMPHSHELWAVIGVYAGAEDNIMWRRLPGDAQGRVEAAGARSLRARDTIAMGSDVVHSVVNPLSRVTAAIHIYGGDFFATPRSEWDPDSLIEKPYDMEKVLRLFADRP